MRRILLACDLDNTLVFSRNHPCEDGVCVEWLEGREQGFIPRRTCQLLQALSSRVQLVPVTTRSVSQYQRIHWPFAAPDCAVTSNGGVLLRNGLPDETWRAETAAVVQPYWTELERLYHLFTAQEDCETCRLVDETYVFTRWENAAAASVVRDTWENRTSLTLAVSGRKLYFLPPAIQKGDALRRFRKAEAIDFCISAGDSLMDVSMLSAADLAVVPNEPLAQLVNGAHVRICQPGQDFSVFIAETAQQIVGQRDRLYPETPSCRFF